jgi:hypothetical protein
LLRLTGRVTLEVMTHGEKAVQIAPTPVARDQPRPATPLDQLVDEVRADATRSPEQYARDAIVAEGGE